MTATTVWGSAPRPVFVLGKHRSGTTWLANQLCAHPAVAGVQDHRHFGIHESEYFTRIRHRYGDLRVRANYIEFVEVLSASDYFRLADATTAFLYSQWPTSYEEVFRAVMDRYAAQRDARLWLEKSPGHTPLAGTLARVYPDALFVGLVREVEDVVASSVAAAARTNPGLLDQAGRRARMITRLVVAWSYYHRVLRSFADASGGAPARMRLVRYDDLRARNRQVLEDLCDFLGLEFDARMLLDHFPRNTNFGSERARHQALTARERRRIALLAGALEAVPLVALTAADGLAAPRRRGPLPAWFFATLPAFPSANDGRPRGTPVAGGAGDRVTAGE